MWCAFVVAVAVAVVGKWTMRFGACMLCVSFDVTASRWVAAGASAPLIIEVCWEGACLDMSLMLLLPLLLLSQALWLPLLLLPGLPLSVPLVPLLPLSPPHCYIHFIAALLYITACSRRRRVPEGTTTPPLPLL